MALDTFEQVKTNAALIKAQVVNAPIMPLGNTTNMQDSQRQQLGQWIDQLNQD